MSQPCYRLSYPAPKRVSELLPYIASKTVMLIKFNNGLDISSSLSESAKNRLLEILVWTVDPRRPEIINYSGKCCNKPFRPQTIPPSRFAPGRFASIFQSLLDLFFYNFKYF